MKPVKRLIDFLFFVIDLLLHWVCNVLSRISAQHLGYSGPISLSHS